MSKTRTTGDILMAMSRTRQEGMTDGEMREKTSREIVEKMSREIGVQKRLGYGMRSISGESHDQLWGGSGSIK